MPKQVPSDAGSKGLSPLAEGFGEAEPPQGISRAKVQLQQTGGRVDGDGFGIEVDIEDKLWHRGHEHFFTFGCGYGPEFLPGGGINMGENAEGCGAAWAVQQDGKAEHIGKVGVAFVKGGELVSGDKNTETAQEICGVSVVHVGKRHKKPAVMGTRFFNDNGAQGAGGVFLEEHFAAEEGGRLRMQNEGNLSLNAVSFADVSYEDGRCCVFVWHNSIVVHAGLAVHKGRQRNHHER